MTGTPPAHARRRPRVTFASPPPRAPPCAAEVLSLYARLRGVPEAAVAGAVSPLLGRLGLAPIAARAAGAYSGGNRRRLSVGVALVGAPPVVLLDEPSTGMVRACTGWGGGARHGAPCCSLPAPRRAARALKGPPPPLPRRTLPRAARCGL